jgi:hypothetical protein
MDEAVKKFMQEAGIDRSIAGGIFKQDRLKAMNIPNVPNIISERLNEMFSSGQSIHDLAQELEQWEKRGNA